jgi:cation diffusion facilitator CzcD-associated flavoprotein CzcO
LFHYYKGRAEKYGVSEFVRLNHRVTSAIWDDGKGKWIIDIKDLISDATTKDEADILINGAGFLK